MFQQTLPWWPNDHFDVAASTRAFVTQFRRRTGNPVKDCWYVQQWNAKEPTDANLTDFLFAIETINYTNRLERVNEIVRTGKLP